MIAKNFNSEKIFLLNSFYVCENKNENYRIKKKSVKIEIITRHRWKLTINSLPKRFNMLYSKFITTELI